MGEQRRSRFISITYGLVGGLFWLWTVVTAGLVVAFAGIARSGHFLIDASVRLPAAAQRLLPRSVEATSAMGVVRVPYSGRHLILFVASHVATTVIILPLLWELRQILGRVRAGEPFCWANVRSLRIFAAVLLVGLPLSDLFLAFVDGALIAHVRTASVGFDAAGAIENIFIGLFVLVLAEVFAYGIRLREDVEGTV